MRLITRSDFDGLACAVLLVEAGLVDDYNFVHPKDLQDGLVEVNANDVLANVPYVPGCGLWFDHHSSEKERLALRDEFQFEGDSRIVPSCARIIYDYYGGPEKFAKFDDNGMMSAVDRCDSGQLTRQEILAPTGWVLLSFLMDPRTGLGYHRDYRISNYQLMMDMIQYCLTMSPEDILALPDCQERVERYNEQEQAYQKMIKDHGRLDGDLLLIDLMDVDQIKVGNRFREYALFPQASISLRMFRGRADQMAVFTCGHSILNRSSTVNVGELMLRFGGGGHTRVGTCQVPFEGWEAVRDALIEAIQEEPALSW